MKTDERSWIFIVGCYNSGTTLLEAMLREHDDIAGLETEGQFLTDALVCPQDVGVPRLWARKEKLFRFEPTGNMKLAKRVKQDWELQLDHPDRPYAIEKSPPNSSRTLWLQANFPNSHFIHIVRNGYVVALGIKEKIANRYGGRPNLLKDAAFQWTRSAEIVIEDSPSLDNFIEIKYEDLVKTPDIIVNRIFNSIGLDHLDNKVFAKNFRIHRQSEKIQNQNEKRLATMSNQEKSIIEKSAGNMLQHYGYFIKC